MIEKFKRYVAWEQFWLGLTGIGIGLLLILYPFFSNWVIQIKIASFLIGVIVLILYIWFTKRNYQKM